jgi:uncharacterized C2H2 Zn-finger protein
MPPKNQVQQSSAWEYFDEIDGSKNVKCKKCGEILQRKDSSTSSMIRHLQKRHNLLKEVTTKEINKNSTLHPYIKIKKEDEEQKIAEETVARMMIRNNSSNLLVECPEMKAMFALAYPKMKVSKEK